MHGNNQNTRCSIPVARLKSVVAEYLAQYETTGTGSNGWYDCEVDKDLLPPLPRIPQLSPVTVLAFRADVSRDTLYNILAGNTKRVAFDTADKLICAMGMPHLWHEDPELRDAYQAVDLSEAA